MASNSENTKSKARIRLILTDDNGEDLVLTDSEITSINRECGNSFQEQDDGSIALLVGSTTWILETSHSKITAEIEPLLPKHLIS